MFIERLELDRWGESYSFEFTIHATSITFVPFRINHLRPFHVTFKILVNRKRMGGRICVTRNMQVFPSNLNDLFFVQQQNVCLQGYSNEVTLRRLPQTEAEQMFEISGGVELVPLLAKHRVSPRRPLPTTDITRMSKIAK